MTLKKDNEEEFYLPDVEGYISFNEAELLYRLAQECSGNGVIVEIGHYQGKSTICLAKGSKAGNGTKIYSIDSHIADPSGNSLKNFIKNIKEFEIDDIIHPIIEDSAEAAKNFSKPIELLFIDGFHRYNDISNDFNAWAPKVIEGGIIAFHDTLTWPGPKRFVTKNIYKSKYFKDVKFLDTISYAKKISKNSIVDRINNLKYLARLNYTDLKFWINFIIERKDMVEGNTDHIINVLMYGCESNFEYFYFHLIDILTGKKKNKFKRVVNLTKKFASIELRKN